MQKFIQFFLCMFFGFFLLGPKQLNKKFYLKQERRRINRELLRGERTFFIPIELFDVLVNELKLCGWTTDIALMDFNSKLRGVSVRCN
jgi:hypothetical protein